MQPRTATTNGFIATLPGMKHVPGVSFTRPITRNNTDARMLICLTALQHNYYSTSFNMMGLLWAPDSMIVDDVQRRARDVLRSSPDRAVRKQVEHFESLQWVIAFENASIVGFAGYHIVDKPDVVLVWLFVVPTHRIRNIGSTLLQMCAVQAHREYGATAMKTDCAPRVQMMRFFAKRHGFSVMKPVLCLDPEGRFSYEDYKKIVVPFAATIGLPLPQLEMPDKEILDEWHALVDNATQYVMRGDATQSEFYRRFGRVITKRSFEPCVWMERKITEEWIQSFTAVPVSQAILAADGGNALFEVD